MKVVKAFVKEEISSSLENSHAKTPTIADEGLC
jgi:hypothetical protein